MSDDVLERLASVIRDRRTAAADQSYTRQLFDGGVGECARKLGEEAVETIIAATSQSDDDLTSEAADLLYHLLVVLESREIALSDVLKILEGRMGVSGLEEKASRAESG